MLGQGNGDHAGQNHQKREQHFRHGRDQRRAPRRRHRFRRHRALNHQEISAPIAKRKHESQPHEHGKPFHSHRVIGGVTHEPPGVGKRARREMLRRRHFAQTSLQSAPTAYIAQPEKNQRRKPRNDEKKLHDFVVDGRGQTA